MPRFPKGSVRCQAARATPRQQQQQVSGPSKLAIGMLGAAAAVTLALSPPALAVEPFLKSTGALLCSLRHLVVEGNSPDSLAFAPAVCSR
jgi:hypothetical protein